MTRLLKAILYTFLFLASALVLCFSSCTTEEIAASLSFSPTSVSLESVGGF